MSNFLNAENSTWLSPVKLAEQAGAGYTKVWYPPLVWHMPPREGPGPAAPASCPALTSGPDMSLQQLHA